MQIQISKENLSYNKLNIEDGKKQYQPAQCMRQHIISTCCSGDIFL